MLFEIGFGLILRQVGMTLRRRETMIKERFTMLFVEKNGHFETFKGLGRGAQSGVKF